MESVKKRPAGWNSTTKPDGPMSVAERNAVLEAWLKEYPRPLKFLIHRWPQLAWRAIRTFGEDEVNAMCLYGGVRAARLFDPGRGFKFPTFAEFHLTAIVRHRLGKSMTEKEQLGDRLLLPLYTVPSNSDDPLDDWPVVDQREPPPHEAVRDDSLCQKIRQIIAENLPCPRDRELMDLRYGLDGGEAMSQSAVGERMGISTTRVWQLEQRMVKKIKHLLRPIHERMERDAG